MANPTDVAGTADAEPCFPPAFPFLIVSPTGESEDAFAMLPDTPIPMPVEPDLAAWKLVLRSAREADPCDPVAAQVAALGRTMAGLLDNDGEALLAITADHAIHVSRDGRDEPETCFMETPWAEIADAMLGHVPLTARLLDDPTETVRRWCFSREVAYLAWDGGSAAHTGSASVLRTATSWFARSKVGLSGPHDTLRDALNAGGFYFNGGCSHAVFCEPDIRDHPAMIDCLIALAAPPSRGVWCNGRALIRNPQGLLFERLPFQKPLPRPPGC